MRKTIVLLLPFVLGALILIVIAAALSQQAPAPTPQGGADKGERDRQLTSAATWTFFTPAKGGKS